MKILVTGGAGYVGAHIVRWLEKQGHAVWVYDNLSRGQRRLVRPERLWEGDLCDLERLTSVLRQTSIDSVVHCAAFTAVGESVVHPEWYYRNNVVGSWTLLEAMRLCEVRRIVFSSTAAVVGAPRQLPITEEADRHPCNPYGRTKALVEDMLADYAAAHGFAAVALRYFNAAGASPDGDLGELHDPETHYIPLLLEVALGRRGNLTLFGDDYPTPDGSCIRDYVHVDDLASAHLAALDRLQPGRLAVYNLELGRGYSNLEVAAACERVTGRPIRLERGPRRAGDPPVLVADPRRALEELGWTPRYRELDAIIATAWNWHRALVEER